MNGVENSSLTNSGGPFLLSIEDRTEEHPATSILQGSLNRALVRSEVGIVRSEPRP